MHFLKLFSKTFLKVQSFFSAAALPLNSPSLCKCFTCERTSSHLQEFSVIFFSSHVLLCLHLSSYSLAQNTTRKPGLRFENFLKQVQTLNVKKQRDCYLFLMVGLIGIRNSKIRNLEGEKKDSPQLKNQLSEN